MFGIYLTSNFQANVFNMLWLSLSLQHTIFSSTVTSTFTHSVTLFDIVQSWKTTYLHPCKRFDISRRKNVVQGSNILCLGQIINIWMKTGAWTSHKWDWIDRFYHILPKCFDMTPCTCVYMCIAKMRTLAYRSA